MNLKEIFREAWEKTDADDGVEQDVDYYMGKLFGNLPDIEIGEEPFYGQEMIDKIEALMGEKVDKKQSWQERLLEILRSVLVQFIIAEKEYDAIYKPTAKDVEKAIEKRELGYKTVVHKVKAFIQELLDEKDKEIAKYQRREDEHCRQIDEIEAKYRGLSSIVDGYFDKEVPISCGQKTGKDCQECPSNCTGCPIRDDHTEDRGNTTPNNKKDTYERE